MGSFLKSKLPLCVAVTAVGEVLNYTFDRNNRRAELRRFFRRVHDALRPGGVLIFDLAGPERELGRVPRRWTAGDDWAILLEASRNSSILERRMTVFREISFPPSASKPFLCRGRSSDRPPNDRGISL